MAISPSKPNKYTAPPETGPLTTQGAGLGWLWLVSNQALMGAPRPAPEPADRPDAEGARSAEVARSWALADRALAQVEGP